MAGGQPRQRLSDRSARLRQTGCNCPSDSGRQVWAVRYGSAVSARQMLPDWFCPATSDRLTCRPILADWFLPTRRGRPCHTLCPCSKSPPCTFFKAVTNRTDCGPYHRRAYRSREFVHHPLHVWPAYPWRLHRWTKRPHRPQNPATKGGQASRSRTVPPLRDEPSARQPVQAERSCHGQRALPPRRH